MSLATRCSNCGTVFRVVQDQLLVSEGWVRCGKCREVFNAIESLFDLKRDVPSKPLPGSVAPGAEQAPIPPDAAPSSIGPNSESPPPSEPPPAEPPPAPEDDARDLKVARASLFGPDSLTSSGFGDSAWREPVDGSAAGKESRSGRGWSFAKNNLSKSRRRRPKSASLRHDRDFQMSEATLDVPIGENLPDEAEVDQLLASNERDTRFVQYEPAPDFRWHGRSRARWSRGRTRLVWRVAALLLGLALALQLVVHNRDAIAARWPSLDPVMQALCESIGCRIEAPRRLASLRVESVSFNETGTPGLYRLAVVLRNHGDMRVRMPALDLRIADGRDETLARRTLTATEMGNAAGAIEAQSEATLQAVLRVSHANVNGYNVTVFYP